MFRPLAIHLDKSASVQEMDPLKSLSIHPLGQIFSVCFSAWEFEKRLTTFWAPFSVNHMLITGSCAPATFFAGAISFVFDHIAAAICMVPRVAHFSTLYAAGGKVR